MQVTFPHRLLLLVAGSALLALTASAANVLVKKDGTRLECKSIRWDAARNEYQVQLMVGGEMSTAIPRKDVSRVDVERPAEIDQARQLMSQNRHAEAIAPLQAVMSGYKGLNWDNTAREYLAQIYVKGNEPGKAIRMVDELITSGAGSSISPNLRLEYWKALLATDKKNPRFAADLDNAIATGSREVVAVAQVRRGDLRRASGRKEEALQDYLRTILFFENAGAVRAEAIAKAAELYEELGDAARAGEIRKLSQK